MGGWAPPDCLPQRAEEGNCAGRRRRLIGLAAALPARCVPVCSRSAALEATVYAGGDKQHKAYAKLSSAAVSSASASSD